MTYVFDIDGTICTNTEGANDYVDAKPFLKRIQVVNKLYDEGNRIFFLTARGMGKNDYNSDLANKEFFDFTNNQLKQWGVKFHKLFLGKPSSDFYIDDKGIKDTDFFE